ncbi:MAG TPA: hypothetical protein VG755_38205 [Nannocystaceae bacterium]|nr:hypothetical protein [Nannocystaceae bacterium]
MRRFVLTTCLLAAACPSDGTNATSTNATTTDADSSSGSVTLTTTVDESSSTAPAESSSTSEDPTLDPTTESSSTDPTIAPETTSVEPAVCGDGMVTGNEACDGEEFGENTCQSQGFMDGALVCSPDCLGFSTANCYVCGDNEIAGTEECDGPLANAIDCESLGYTTGQVTCDMSTCQLDMSGCSLCGDGVAEGEESCDMGDLGGADCDSLGFTGGPLGCNESCGFNILTCDVPGNPFGSDTGYNGFSLTPGITSCDDILGTGTPTGLTDDSQVEVPIGFTFPFYDTNYDNVTIESNGTMHFGGNLYLSYSNDCMPSLVDPSDNNLYVFWDDMNPGAGGGVYYETLGSAGDQRFVVQWHTAHYSGDTLDLIDYRVVLYQATGQISVCYVDTLSAGNAGDNGAEATAGIQTSSSDGFYYSCNTPDLVNGLELLYLPI